MLAPPPAPAAICPDGVGACYYVNDCCTTGDVYTTGVGDGTLGCGAITSATPQRSVDYVIRNCVAAGDRVFVDTGVYFLRRYTAACSGGGFPTGGNACNTNPDRTAAPHDNAGDDLTTHVDGPGLAIPLNVSIIGVPGPLSTGANALATVLDARVPDGGNQNFVINLDADDSIRIAYIKVKQNRGIIVQNGSENNVFEGILGNDFSACCGGAIDGAGIVITGNSTGNVVRNCRFNSNEDAGVEVLGSDNVIIENSTFVENDSIEILSDDDGAGGCVAGNLIRGGEMPVVKVRVANNGSSIVSLANLVRTGGETNATYCDSDLAADAPDAWAGVWAVRGTDATGAAVTHRAYLTDVDITAPVASANDYCLQPGETAEFTFTSFVPFPYTLCDGSHRTGMVKRGSFLTTLRVNPTVASTSVVVLKDLVRNTGTLDGLVPFTDQTVEITTDPDIQGENQCTAANLIAVPGTLEVQTGTATAATATTLTDGIKTWTANEWTDNMVVITGGTGLGQERRIVSNTGTVLTISPDWTTIPDATSTYRMVQRRAEGDM